MKTLPSSWFIKRSLIPCKSFIIITDVLRYLHYLTNMDRCPQTFGHMVYVQKTYPSKEYFRLVHHSRSAQGADPLSDYYIKTKQLELSLLFILLLQESPFYQVVQGRKWHHISGIVVPWLTFIKNKAQFYISLLFPPQPEKWREGNSWTSWRGRKNEDGGRDWLCLDLYQVTL